MVHDGPYHVYKVFWNAHGGGFNDYSERMLERLSDGGLTLSASGCVFVNESQTSASWVIKQLPLTAFASTVAGV